MRVPALLRTWSNAIAPMALACVLALGGSCGVGVSSRPRPIAHRDAQAMDTAADRPVSDGGDAKADVLAPPPDGGADAVAGAGGIMNAGSGGAAGGGAGGGGATGSGGAPVGMGVVPPADGGVTDAPLESAPPADASADGPTADGMTRDVPACPAGAHRCGPACVPDSSPETCGAACAPCLAPPNATATCDGNSCGFVCALGTHRCGNRCAEADDVTACGSQCATCATDDNSVPACVAGACRLACKNGFHLCGQQCVSNASAGSCGTACTPCSAPPGASAVCRQEQCAIVCPDGLALCGTACIAAGTPCAGVCPARSHLCAASCLSDSNVASCGATACSPCPVPDGATEATCDGFQCGVVCAPDRHRCGTTCPGADRSMACVGTTVASTPRTFVRADGQQAIVFVSPGGHVIEIANAPSGPMVTDATESAHGVLCASDVWGYRRSDDLSALVYRGVDKHIHELTRAPGSSGAWRDTDLTVAASGGVVPDGDPQGYVRSDDVNVVVYRKDGHVHALSRVDGTWRSRDLTVVAVAYLTAPAVGNPMGFRRSDDNNAVVYRDSENRIRELTGLNEDTTFDHDIFQQTGTETVPALGDPWGYISSRVSDTTHTDAILYIGTDHMVHELMLTFPLSGSGWTSSILPSSGALGRPSAQLGSDGRRVVVYRSVDGAAAGLTAIISGATWSSVALPLPGFARGTAVSDPFVGLGAGTSVGVVYRSEGNELVEYRLAPSGASQIVTY